MYYWFSNNIQTPNTAQQTNIQWSGLTNSASAVLNLNVSSTNFAVQGQSNELRVQMGDTITGFSDLNKGKTTISDSFDSLAMPTNSMFCVFITNQLLSNVSQIASNYYT